MNAEANIEAVRAIYDAFGRQDVAAILEHLHNDVKWNAELSDEGPPWLRPRNGHDGVAEFFESLQEVEFETFRPYSFMADGPFVVALLHVELTVEETGRRVVDESEAHLWRFDADGKVLSLRHLVNTRAHHVAWAGE
jgi:ketosteroid isomerase-like protein